MATLAGINPSSFLYSQDSYSYLGRCRTFPRTRSEQEPTGELIISYEYSDDVSLYASGKRGYKAGGFNVGAGSGGADFDKELADAWEVGAKIRALDNNLQFNIAAFSQRLRDFQSNAFNGTTFVLTNAGEIQIDGFEFDALYAPTSNLFLSLRRLISRSRIYELCWRTSDRSTRWLYATTSARSRPKREAVIRCA